VRSIALRAASHKHGQESSEGSDGKTLNFLTSKFNKFLKKKNNDKNQSSNRYNNKKSMISILQIIRVLDVVNRVISRPIVPTMKAKREEQARNLRRREKLKEPTLPGKGRIRNK